MTEFRFKPDQMDAGHVHVRVFVGPEGNGALAGTLTFAPEEFEDFQRQFRYQRVVSIIEMGDGRYAVANERDIGNLTEPQMMGIWETFRLWAGTIGRSRGWLGDE